jgi:uncharacterized membrane protein
MTDAKQSDTPVSQEAREAAGKFLKTDPRDPVAQPLAAAFDQAIAAAEQRGRLAERERCAGIARDEKVDAAATGCESDCAYNHACDHIEQAILSAKE